VPALPPRLAHAGWRLAAPLRGMLSCRTVAKHLRLRAAVVDIAALERSALEPKAKRQETLWGPIKLRSAAEEIAKRNVQVLLQSEIRQELSKRGAPLVGKPWELKARLAEIWQAEEDQEDASGGLSGPLFASAAVPSFAQKSAGPSDDQRDAATDRVKAIRDKYADKMRLRTGSGLPHQSDAAGKDAAVHCAIAGAAAKAVSPTGWRFRSGARELCQYLDVRGIRRILLDDSSATVEEAADRAAELTRQFQLEAWCHVLSPADAAKLYAGDPAALEAAGDAVGLPLSSILLLSAEPRAVAAARAARMPSCYFARDVPGYPKAVPADAVARNMNDVRTAVEDFCGVTFRDATTHISTRYGI